MTPQTEMTEFTVEIPFSKIGSLTSNLSEVLNDLTELASCVNRVSLVIVHKDIDIPSNNPTESALNGMKVIESMQQTLNDLHSVLSEFTVHYTGEPQSSTH